jgi:hypothetical protein
VTRGHGGWESKQRHHVSWVSSYTLSYSNDTLLWFSYRDGNHLDPKVFLSFFLYAQIKILFFHPRQQHTIAFVNLFFPEFVGGG